MLRIPLQPNRDDAAVLKEAALNIAEIYMKFDSMPGTERRDAIVFALKEYEASWS